MTRWLRWMHGAPVVVVLSQATFYSDCADDAAGVDPIEAPEVPIATSAPAEKPAAPCLHAGCFSQLCVAREAADDVVTACLWRPVYGCYQRATCTVLPDGACGFVPTEALAVCLQATAGSFCDYGGRLYIPGETFPALDDCNSCTCDESGRVACTKTGCPWRPWP